MSGAGSTLCKASERYFAENPVGYKDGYRYQQSVCLRAFLSYFPDDMLLSTIVPAVAEEALARIVSERGVSGSAVVAYRTALRNFLNWCVKQGLVESNPYPPVNGRPRKDGHSKVRITTVSGAASRLTRDEKTELFALKHSMEFFLDCVSRTISRLGIRENNTKPKG